MAESGVSHSLSALLNHSPSVENGHYSNATHSTTSPTHAIHNPSYDNVDIESMTDPMASPMTNVMSEEPQVLNQDTETPRQEASLKAEAHEPLKAEAQEPPKAEEHEPPKAEEQEHGHGKREEEDDTESGPVTCLWENCHLVFSKIPELVSHLAEEHVNKKVGPFACEWKDCPRFGLAQTTRFSLISHMRCHTGEKPFVCPHCKKAFPRADAMQKHVKSQHGEQEAALESVELSSELGLATTDNESHKEESRESFSDTAKTLEGLKAQGIPVFVQKIRLVPKRKLRAKKKKAIAANLVMHKSLLFESQSLSTADKDKLAQYYVEHIEHKDLTHEHLTLLKKINRLKKQVNLLKNEIWP